MIVFDEVTSPLMNDRLMYSLSFLYFSLKMSEPRKSLDDTGDDESSEDDERSYETPEEKRKSETNKQTLDIPISPSLSFSHRIKYS